MTDAITDTDEDAHLNSLRATFPRIAELATTEEVLTALPAANRRSTNRWIFKETTMMTTKG
jgi:isochorismate hydrolase